MHTKTLIPCSLNSIAQPLNAATDKSHKIISIEQFSDERKDYLINDNWFQILSPASQHLMYIKMTMK